MMHITSNETIKIVTNRLREAYNPLSIFLFGSYAWGTPTKDSDLDMLIVVDESDESQYIRPRKGFKALRGMKIAKDLVVYTKQEFNEYSAELASFAYKIKNDGIKLYERS
jgi:predicted nucleotidyltransferase